MLKVANNQLGGLCGKGEILGTKIEKKHFYWADTRISRTLFRNPSVETSWDTGEGTEGYFKLGAGRFVSNLWTERSLFLHEAYSGNIYRITYDNQVLRILLDHKPQDGQLFSYGSLWNTTVSS